MEQEWWYADGNQKTGPLPLSDFLECLRDGRINLDTLVWQSDWKDWRKLIEVEETQTQVLAALGEQRRQTPPPLPPSSGV